MLFFSILGDNDGGADLLVMGGPEVLGEVVANVFTSGLPVDKELTLFDMVSNPVEYHVYCLGTRLLDCVIRNSGSTLVVCLHGSGRTGMTKLI